MKFGRLDNRGVWPLSGLITVGKWPSVRHSANSNGCITSLCEMKLVCPIAADRRNEQKRREVETGGL